MPGVYEIFYPNTNFRNFLKECEFDPSHKADHFGETPYETTTPRCETKVRNRRYQLISVKTT